MVIAIHYHIYVYYGQVYKIYHDAIVQLKVWSFIIQKGINLVENSQRKAKIPCT